MKQSDYMVLVTLLRLDRPKRWLFHCPNCKRPIKEIDGELVAMTDSYNTKDHGMYYRCDTSSCRIFYQFHISENKR